jgi:hypothetical protein
MLTPSPFCESRDHVLLLSGPRSSTSPARTMSTTSLQKAWFNLWGPMALTLLTGFPNMGDLMNHGLMPASMGPSIPKK